MCAVESVPNKRGPVELGLLATGAAWTREGGRFSIGFLTEPVPWYADLLDQAGIETFVVGSDTWDADVLAAAAKRRPDLVHLHFGRHTMAGRLRRDGIRVIRTEHSHRSARSLEPLRRLVRRRRQRPLDQLIAVSASVAEQTVHDFRVSRERVSLVPNGVDTGLFRPRPDERSALRERWLGLPDDAVVATCAAWLTPRKRQHLLLEALAVLAPEFPRAALVLAGDGEQRAELIALRDRLDLSDRVRILFGDNDIPQIYAAGDIAALVSWGEGMPGAALEGMATGLPLLATPTPGIRDVYEDDVGGVSAPTDDAAGVAAAWRRLLLDEEFRREQGRLARAAVEARFSLDAHAAGTVEVYRQVLDRRA